MLHYHIWQLIVGLTVLLHPATAWSSHRGVADVYVTHGQSIQQAIKDAPKGTRIIVGPGTYKEYLTIDKDGISLVGRGAILRPADGGATRNLCSGIAGPGTEVGICIAGAGVELADFVTEHQKVTSVRRPVVDVSVKGFEVHGFGGANIAVYGGQNTLISGNKLIDGGVYGLLSAGSRNTRVENNEVGSTGVFKIIAICTDNFSGVHTVGNKISGYLLGLCLQTAHSLQERNLITDCCTGIYVDPGLDGIKVRDNVIRGKDPQCLQGWPFNGGIYLDGPRGTQVEGNLIQGQRANNQGFGVAIADGSTGTTASNNQVKNNKFTNNDVDIVVTSTGSGNQVKNNQCTSSNPPGLCT